MGWYCVRVDETGGDEWGGVDEEVEGAGEGDEGCTAEEEDAGVEW